MPDDESSESSDWSQLSEVSDLSSDSSDLSQLSEVSQLSQVSDVSSDSSDLSQVSDVSSDSSDWSQLSDVSSKSSDWSQLSDLSSNSSQLSDVSSDSSQLSALSELSSPSSDLSEVSWLSSVSSPSSESSCSPQLSECTEQPNRTQECDECCKCNEGYCSACGCPKQESLGLGSNGWDANQSFGGREWMGPPHICKFGGYVVVEVGSCNGYWFTESGPSTSPTYASIDPGTGATLTFDHERCQFDFTYCNGNSLQFDEYGESAGAVNPGDESPTEVTDYTPEGLIGEVQTAFNDAAETVESFIYDYLPGFAALSTAVPGVSALAAESSSLLWRVTLRRRSGDGPWFNLRRVVYTYYGNDETGGPEGLLKTATTQLPCGLEWVDLDTQYFRYYVEGETGGYAGALKFVLEPSAFARMRETTDPLTASDAALAGFATRYFEYDETTERISKLVADAGLMTSLFAYEFNSASSASDDDFNVWAVKTTTTRPDGSRTIEFYNVVDKLMLRDTVEDVLPSGTRHWIEYHRFNDYGLDELSASPSAVISYDEGVDDLGVVLRTDAGLVHTTTYYTSTTATPTVLGGVEAYVESTALQEGSAGDSVPQSLTRYFRCPNVSNVFEVGETTVYRNDDGTGEIVTTYAYEWFDDTAQISQKTTTWPIVPTGQNGSGLAYQTTELYDLDGKLIWERGPKGYIRKKNYDAVTGALLQRIEDVDGALVPLPDGWVTPAGGGLNLVTDYEADDQGRTTQTLGPAHDASGQGVRTAQWTVYDDVGRRTLSALGYASGLAGSYVYTLVNPVSIARRTSDGRFSESIRAVRTCRCDSYASGVSPATCCDSPSGCAGACEAAACPRCCTGRLTAADCFPQATWVAWSKSFFNIHGQRTSSRVYHRIPACGEGTSGAAGDGGDYDETTYGYDVMNRQNRVVTPGGTITRTVFDVRGLNLETFVGTDDAGATDDDPTGAAAGPAAAGNNMVPTVENVYDDGADGGDGNLTSTISPVDDDSGHDRVTSYEYDFRNRQTATSAPEDVFSMQVYDNLGHTIETTSYVGDSSGAPISSTYTSFDDRGQVYRSEQSGYDATTNVETARLTSLSWYDPAGNPIKQVAAGAKDLRAFTKSSYDGVGRRTATYVGIYTGEQPEPYASISSVEDDLVFEQSVPAYDQAGNVLETTSLSRYPSDVTTTGPLDTSLGRPSRSATWYDGVNRAIASASYGTSEVERSDEPPPSTDEVPVSRNRYDAAGQAFESIDPAGRIARSALDAAGRLTASIANYTGGRAGNVTDVTVRRTYDSDGQLRTLTAVNPDTGDQTTTYYYGVTPADGSKLASNDLLQAVVYPDAKDVTDRVSYAYNRQGEAIAMTDQNGTRHEYDYDGLGRRTEDRVTTVGTGVADAVRRLETVYDDRQQIESQSSYDAPSGGTLLNQVAYTYNAFGLLYQETQTAGATEGVVTYFYADGTANTTRKTLVVYPAAASPAARQLRYRYGDADSPTDRLSQIASIDDDYVATPLVGYTYLGVNSIFRCDYLEPEVRWDLSPVGNSFTGLDSLGRVVDNLWRNYGDSTDADRVQYTYDRNGNRTSRKNDVAASANDELYRYDGLNRLTNLARGTLTDGAAPLSAPQAGEAWRLDATGNWNGYQSLDFTTPADTVEQNRTANQANEITAITAEVGPAWAQPLYDRAGNMISLPQPKAPTDGYTATYDAWNRLIKLEDESSTVAEYGYDALTRRITVDDGANVRRTYFSSQWQALEERLDDSTDTERQFIWGLRYIDDLVLRDRSAGGTLDERLYALQDANWNVTAIVDDGGDVEERYRYSAYGTPTFLQPDFSPKTPNESEFDWQTLYCGYRFDEDSGLYCVRYRYLNAVLGEWITRDPVKYDAGLNLYNYCTTMPIQRVDPLGLWEMRDLARKVCCCPASRKYIPLLQGIRFELCDNFPIQKLTTPPYNPMFFFGQDPRWENTGRFAYGLTDRRNRLVQISRAQTLDDAAVAAIHEVQHVIQGDPVGETKAQVRTKLLQDEVDAFTVETRVGLACGWKSKHTADFTRTTYYRRRALLPRRRIYSVIEPNVEAIEEYVRVKYSNYYPEDDIIKERIISNGCNRQTWQCK